MKTKHAFTLIEVMVVLSILALIAILAYNFFGNTMKEAKLKQGAAKIYNDLRTINEAMDLYVIKNGVTTPSLSQLVTDGYLKSLPAMDSSLCYPAGGACDYDFLTDYDAYGGPTGAFDDIIGVWPVGLEMCKAFNTYYGPASLADSYHDFFGSGNVHLLNEPVNCTDDYSDGTRFSILWVTEYN